MDPRLLEPEVQETIRSTLASMQASLERMMAACNDMRELTKMNPIKTSEFHESTVAVGSVNSDDEDRVEDLQSDDISSLQDNNINSSVIVSVEPSIESLMIQTKGNHSPDMFVQYTQMEDDIILNVSSQIIPHDAIFLNDFYWPTARDSFHLSASDGNRVHCHYVLSGIENFTKPLVTTYNCITFKEWPPPATGAHYTKSFPSTNNHFKNDSPRLCSRQLLNTNTCSDASVSNSGGVTSSWFKLLCMCILRKYMLPVMSISLNISVRITLFGNTAIRRLAVESVHVRMLLLFACDSNLGTRCDETICICWFIKSLVIFNSGNSVSDGEYTRISNEFLPRLPIVDACYYSAMIFTPPTSRVVQSVREYNLNSYSFKDGISDGTATLRSFSCLLNIVEYIQPEELCKYFRNSTKSWEFLKCFYVWLYYKGWGFYNAKTVSQIIWWVPSLLDQFTGNQSPFLTERYSDSLCTLSRRGLACLLRTFDGSLSFPIVLYPLTMLIVLVDFLTTQCAWTVIPCGQAWIVRGCLGLVSHFYWAKRQGVSIAHKQWSSETHVCQGQLVFLLWTDVKLYLVSAPNSHGLDYLFSFCSQCARHFRFHNLITSLTSIHSILGSQIVNIKDIIVIRKMLMLGTVWNSRLYNNPSHLHSSLILQPNSSAGPYRTSIFDIVCISTDPYYATVAKLKSVSTKLLVKVLTTLAIGFRYLAGVLMASKTFVHVSACFKGLKSKYKGNTSHVAGYICYHYSFADLIREPTLPVISPEINKLIFTSGKTVFLLTEWRIGTLASPNFWLTTVSLGVDHMSIQNQLFRHVAASANAAFLWLIAWNTCVRLPNTILFHIAWSSTVFEVFLRVLYVSDGQLWCIFDGSDYLGLFLHRSDDTFANLYLRQSSTSGIDSMCSSLPFSTQRQLVPPYLSYDQSMHVKLIIYNLYRLNQLIKMLYTIARAWSGKVQDAYTQPSGGDRKEYFVQVGSHLSERFAAYRLMLLSSSFIYILSLFDTLVMWRIT